MSDGSMSFERRTSTYEQQRLSVHFKRNAWTGPPSEAIYAGLSFMFSAGSTFAVAIAIRDNTYLLDSMEHEFSPEESRDNYSKAVDFVVRKLREFSERHMEKFLGIAMPHRVSVQCPSLCPRLWGELDIVPLALPEESWDGGKGSPSYRRWLMRSLDEQAESMGRKCVRQFGPGRVPLLQVGFLGLVEVDTAFQVHLATVHELEKTVGPRTWAAIQHYATDLKRRKVSVAFFSATPQGGGVALMRHALVRLAHALDIDFKWYVPKPRPGVFRVTKTIHNILQGVSSPDEHVSKDKSERVTKWIEENAKRYWMCPGGPLKPPSEGGADLVVVDDPQMPTVIPLSKSQAPERPVIFRSHIQIRSDLTSQPATPQAETWAHLWDSIKLADLFISHPVKSFVPHNVPSDTIGYMPATTDWLDGLNKNMRDADTAFYGRLFNSACRDIGMPTINYPEDKYIVQIARFDPSKGIFDAVEAYHKFHQRLISAVPDMQPPKLLICGHGSVDDPDGVFVYDSVVAHIEHDLAYVRDMICVKRLRPSDQVLNTLLSKARVVLQLSTREGFEVKVSEAIHKGKPVIATRAGGIPLQVAHGKNGFLVDVGDTDAVADYLFKLWTDDGLYGRLSEYGRANVGDEVSTCGNMVNWLYLASKLTKGEDVKPNGRWINDMAREEAGQPYTPDENRLKREVDVYKVGSSSQGLDNTRRRQQSYP